MVINYTKHALKRRKQREINHSDIIDVLQSGSSNYHDGNIWIFKKRNTVIVFDVFHMIVITCMRANDNEYSEYRIKNK